jgi:hypothetical protein
MRVNWILPSTTKTLMNSTQNFNQMNTDESWLDITKRNKNSHELYSKFERTQSWLELVVKHEREFQLPFPLINSHTRSTVKTMIKIGFFSIKIYYIFSLVIIWVKSWFSVELVSYDLPLRTRKQLVPILSLCLLLLSFKGAAVIGLRCCGFPAMC